MKRFIFFIVLVFSILLLVTAITDNNSNPLYYYNFSCFLITTIISIYFLSMEKYEYSLNMFFWLFILFFMGIIPLMQYVFDAFPWSRLTSEEVLKGNIVNLVFIWVYILVYFLRNKLGRHKTPKLNLVVRYKSLNYKFAFILFIFSALILIASHPGEALFLRSASSKLSKLSRSNGGESSSATSLLIDKTTRYFIFYFLVFTYHYRNKFTKVFRWMVYAISVLTNFPLAVARNFAASFYIGFLLTIKRRIKNQFLVSSTMILILAVVFPIMSFFRYSYATYDYISLHLGDIMRTFWASPDFDAFSMLCRAIKYVGVNGSTLGNQLLGVIFFFIPRSIWPTKAIGSGHLIAQWYGFVFENLACPISAEGMMNFGIIGVIIFAVFLAILTQKYDKLYWYSISNNITTFWTLMYPGFLGLFFFMLRGDLLSSYAYIFGMFVPGLLMHKILTYQSFSKSLKTHPY